MSLQSPIETREMLIHELTAAAALEHSVVCQYLFAAFSMKRRVDEGGVTWLQLERMREWQADLLLVAREEMEHLGLVCNLLTAVGGVPGFRRPPFPHASPYARAGDLFALEPFGERLVAALRYVEKMHGCTEPPDEGAATEAVGALYGRIRQGIEHLHETTGMLFVGPPEAQVDNPAIDLPEGWYDVHLLQVVDLASALRAIDQIVEAGDGDPRHAEDSHFVRLSRIERELCDMRAADPDFEPSRPVVANPTVETIRHAPEASAESGDEITHPTTRRAAELFNAAYETMLLMLVRFYSRGDGREEQRAALLRIAFFPMMTMVIRPLGEMLTLMPAHREVTGRTAGPTFETRDDLLFQPHDFSAWIRLHEKLDGLASDCKALGQDVRQVDAPWAAAIRPRLAFLEENLVRTAHNFEASLDLHTARVHHLMTKVL